MSFEHIPHKPALVEKKILKYVNNRMKQKYMAVKEKEIEVIKQSETWYSKLGDYMLEFMKENYGFVLLFLLISLLLLVRYIEYNKKKEKIKEIITKYTIETQNSIVF
jgi:hypothetical protein